MDGQGLHPSSKGAQVVFQGGETSVIDGPFTESKEIVAGYWVWQVSIRPVFADEDFGAEYTDELRERDARLAEEIKAQHG